MLFNPNLLYKKSNLQLTRMQKYYQKIEEYYFKANGRLSAVFLQFEIGLFRSLFLFRFCTINNLICC